MNPTGGGCGEPTSHHCTPAWASRAKLGLKKEIYINYIYICSMSYIYIYRERDHTKKNQPQRHVMMKDKDRNSLRYTENKYDNNKLFVVSNYFKFKWIKIPNQKTQWQNE